VAPDRPLAEQQGGESGEPFSQHLIRMDDLALAQRLDRARVRWHTGKNESL